MYILYKNNMEKTKKNKQNKRSLKRNNIAKEQNQNKTKKNIKVGGLGKININDLFNICKNKFEIDTNSEQIENLYKLFCVENEEDLKNKICKKIFAKINNPKNKKYKFNTISNNLNNNDELEKNLDAVISDQLTSNKNNKKMILTKHIKNIIKIKPPLIETQQLTQQQPPTETQQPTPPSTETPPSTPSTPLTPSTPETPSTEEKIEELINYFDNKVDDQEIDRMIDDIKNNENGDYKINLNNLISEFDKINDFDDQIKKHVKYLKGINYENNGNNQDESDAIFLDAYINLKILNELNKKKKKINNE